jgi:hypothetical protein
MGPYFPWGVNLIIIFVTATTEATTSIQLTIRNGPILNSCSLGGLVATCIKLSGYILEVINKTKLVDATIRVIGVEIESLSKVLDSIRTSFSDPALASAALSSGTGFEAEHWRNVEQSLDDCKGTLRELEDCQPSQSRLVRRPTEAINLALKSGKITLLKQQISLYKETLTISLHMLDLYQYPICVLSTTDLL